MKPREFTPSKINFADEAARRVADRLTRRIIYWAVIRAWAWVSTTEEFKAKDSTGITCADVARAWKTW